MLIPLLKKFPKAAFEKSQARIERRRDANSDATSNTLNLHVEIVLVNIFPGNF